MNKAFPNLKKPIRSSYRVFAMGTDNKGKEIVGENITKNVTINNLVDFDWRFGVISGSSELKQVGSTFLQLQLLVDKGNGERENLYMELSLSQFYSFLHEMERAKTSLDIF